MRASSTRRGTASRDDEAYERLAEAERDQLAAIDRGTYAELTAIVLFVAAART